MSKAPQGGAGLQACVKGRLNLALASEGQISHATQQHELGLQALR